MANLNDVLQDPDFWGPETTDDDRKWTLGKVDKKFGAYGPAEQDRFLKNLAKTRSEQQQKEAKEHEAKAQVVLPKVENQQTMYELVVAPITAAVGLGLEQVGNVGVPLARMLQGEGLAESLNPRGIVETMGAGGKAAEARKQAAGAVVPQTPWQAGAMGVQLIPGMGSVGTMGRIGASAGAAGALQGLLGKTGLVEGGTPGQAAGEAVSGALKGGATQAAGEVVGKALGGVQRIPGTGRSKRISEADYSRVQKTVGEIAPEYAGAGRKAAEGGVFYKGTHGAKEAAEQAFGGKLAQLEAELVKTQGHPYVNAPELVDAYKKLAALAKREPGLGKQIADLAPNGNLGFLPQQAAKIISLTGERLGGGQTGLGHLKNAAMDDLVAAVEAALPAGQGILTAARSGFARSRGLEELMAPAFKAKKGYGFDIRKLQEALSENPDLINRLGEPELKKLLAAATRGASTKPGFADVTLGQNVSIPYPSWQGAAVAALRNLLTKSKHVGELPGTAPQWLKQLLGVATTGAVSSRSVPKER